MDFSQPSQPTVPPDPNISYHYLYGRKHTYGAAHAAVPYWPAPGRYRTHYISAGKALGRLDEGPQTVEQLIDQGYFAAPAAEPETSFLYDSRHSAWLGLDDFVTQIRQRRELYGRNMTGIEWAQCYAFNELARGGWPPTTEQEVIYNKRLQELHAEQRAERIALWRDLSRLRQVIPESVHQYLAANRKLELLSDAEDDAL